MTPLIIFIIGASQSPYNGAYQEAFVRGLDCSDEIIAEALSCQKHIRTLLEDKMFKIIARWIKRAKSAGKLSQACMLHAHLAFIYRNVEAEDLNPRNVFAILASQIFLYNYFKFDVDLTEQQQQGGVMGKRSKSRKLTIEEREAEKSVQNTELIIPHVELFDMFQRNRLKLFKWLEKLPAERNKVMDGILSLIEGENPDKASQLTHVVQAWLTPQRPGFSFAGRYVPEQELVNTEFDGKLSHAGKHSFEEWLREVTTLLVNTEINVQLGEFTIKKNAIQPLTAMFLKNEDFIAVFEKVTGEY